MSEQPSDYSTPATTKQCSAIIAELTSEKWRPSYEPWRHGGSYVWNLRYPSGAVGCIASARHTISGKFEIACDPRRGTGVDEKELQYKTRDEAAYAERDLVVQMWRDVIAKRSRVAA